MAQAKASVTIQLMEEFKTAQNFYHFDPDIVVRRNWDFFEAWVTYGVCLIEEMVNRRMSSDHPQRMMWKEWATERGYTIRRSIGKYFNSGFFAFKRGNCDFLKHWDSILAKRQEEGFEVDPDGGHKRKFLSELNRFRCSPRGTKMHSILP